MYLLFLRVFCILITDISKAVETRWAFRMNSTVYDDFIGPS